MVYRSYAKFPDLLDDAKEIKVFDGDKVGIFFRRSQFSEGYPIFSKFYGSEESWQLKKIHGTWSFLKVNDGFSQRRESWEPQTKLWVRHNGTKTTLFIRVKKRFSSKKKASYKSWGENLIKTMWEQQMCFNIKIKLQDGEEIDAHKAVIAAACPAWKELSEPSMVEAGGGVIIVDDINPNAVKGFIKAFYFGEFEDQTLLPGIALMADRFKIEKIMHKVVLAMPKALETQGPDFYVKVVETLKRLSDTENKRMLKAMLYSMNKLISEEVFYKLLGIS